MNDDVSIYFFKSTMLLNFTYVNFPHGDIVLVYFVN